MNERSDIGGVLRHWFDDGPSRMPDRVVDIVADRIARQPQQPAWLPRWRERHVNTNVKLLTAVAAIAVVAVAGFALLGPRAGPNVGVSSTPSPSVAPSPTASLAWDDQSDAGGGCGQPACAGPIPAGTYTTLGLQPALTYTLTSNWVNNRDFPDYFVLYPDTPANRTAAASGQGGQPTILVLPGPLMVASTTCAGDVSSGEVDMSAAEYADYLATREGLTIEAIPVTIGRLSGRQIDVGLAADSTRCAEGVTGDELTTEAGRERIIALDTPTGGTLKIRIWASSNFDAFVQNAMPVVESFEFDVSP
jgi:hypothetical protein